MGDVIDIRSRLKAQGQSKELTTGAQAPTVIDISEMRQDLLNEDRRKVKRTILTEFLSAHTVIPGMGLLRVALYDINEHGLAFDIDTHRGNFQVGEEVAMRVYLNHQTYFPFIVKVRHVAEVKEEDVFRHGVEFVKGTINDVALHHFVKFIENVSAALKSDRGDVLVSNIKS
ncbi:MAG: PilZ domain-containing protein [Bdellovibrio sp. CG10_big_fil_rev_8_21_14_0_10_47_8]|nr:MAG: PilZ domain-containing protein [Bdellovibrio sp. CG10_big_fil_rev_8_21_14_0_10_47_8]